jgi:hypothetical protein
MGRVFADLWWHFDPPKTASVSIGATAVAIGGSVSIGISGNAYIQAPGHTFKLWLEKWDTGSSIPVVISDKYGGSGVPHSTTQLPKLPI